MHTHNVCNVNTQCITFADVRKIQVVRMSRRSLLLEAEFFLRHHCTDAIRWIPMLEALLHLPPQTLGRHTYHTHAFRKGLANFGRFICQCVSIYYLNAKCF